MHGGRARAVATHLAVGLSAVGLVSVAAWVALQRASARPASPAEPGGAALGAGTSGVLVETTLAWGIVAAVGVVVLGSALAAVHLTRRGRLSPSGRRSRPSPVAQPAGWFGMRPVTGGLARHGEVLEDGVAPYSGSGDGEARGEQPDVPLIGGDLDRLRRELADIEGRRRQLLGDVAHEMRTPLTIIDGYVEGMIDGIIPAEADELAHVSDEVRRLRRLADDLSALSRAQEGRLELRPTRLDCRTVVTCAAERLRPQVEDAGLQLQVEPGERALPVAVDQDRMSQVVRNLIGNAVRATAPGGQVILRLGETDRWTWFSVRDTGEGIDPADLERIFERFYRVAGRRSARGETGSGIGLTIARDIVRAHGGELVARSGGRGCGAEFVAWLPRSLTDGI